MLLCRSQALQLAPLRIPLTVVSARLRRHHASVSPASDHVCLASEVLSRVRLVQGHDPCEGSNRVRLCSADTAVPWSDAVGRAAPLGSSFLQSSVDLAAVPNPSGTSFILKQTTPAYCGVFSVMRPRPDLSTWFPYRKDISLLPFIQTCSEARGRGQEDEMEGRAAK